jgi:hypothetical protein
LMVSWLGSIFMGSFYGNVHHELVGIHHDKGT